MPNERSCPHCSTKIPGWWVRDYCANCGEEIPQTGQLAEIARLREVIEDIDSITGYDWETMPEASKRSIHKHLRELVHAALARPEELTATSTNLREGDLRQAGDEYYDGAWKPIPKERIGLPIFPSSFPHRRPGSTKAHCQP